MYQSYSIGTSEQLLLAAGEELFLRGCIALKYLTFAFVLVKGEIKKLYYLHFEHVAPKLWNLFPWVFVCPLLSLSSTKMGRHVSL